MKLIDADKLFDAMEETKWYNNADRDEIAERLIMDAPSIDIVHCGECKYYEAKEDWCYWRDEAITADDFCSYGSRSEKPNNSERSSE